MPTEKNIIHLEYGKEGNLVFEEIIAETSVVLQAIMDLIASVSLDTGISPDLLINQIERNFDEVYLEDDEELEE